MILFISRWISDQTDQLSSFLQCIMEEIDGDVNGYVSSRHKKVTLIKRKSEQWMLD